MTVRVAALATIRKFSAVAALQEAAEACGDEL